MGNERVVATGSSIKPNCDNTKAHIAHVVEYNHPPYTHAVCPGRLEDYTPVESKPLEAACGRTHPHTPHPFGEYMDEKCNGLPFVITEKLEPVRQGSKEELHARQVGGSHYTSKKIQPWDVWENDSNMDPFTATVIKYMMRWREKNGITDLEKALHTLQYLIEVEKGREKE